VTEETLETDEWLALLCDTDLEEETLAVAAYLESIMDDDGTVWGYRPSVVGRALEMTWRDVRRRTNELVDTGWLIRAVNKTGMVIYVAEVPMWVYPWVITMDCPEGHTFH
jgi:hypothetical protein